MTPTRQLLAASLLGGLVCIAGTLVLAIPKITLRASLQHLPPRPSLIKRETLLSAAKEGTLSASFSPDSKLLACAGFAGEVRLWDVPAKKLTRKSYGKAGLINSVAFSPDGQLLAAGADDALVLWNVKTGRVVHRIPMAPFSAIHSVCFSPDGKTLAAGSGPSNGTTPYQIELRNVATGRLQKTLSADWDVISSLKFAPDGKSLVSASYDNTVQCWDIRSGSCLWTHFGTMSYFTAIFSPDGKTIATSCQDGWVRFLSPRTGQVVRTLDRSFTASYTLAFTPDSCVLIGGGYNSKIAFWKMPEGKLWQVRRAFTGQLHNFETAARPLDRERYRLLLHDPSAVLVSPDGAHFAISSFDGELKMWDMNTTVLVTNTSLP